MSAFASVCNKFCCAWAWAKASAARAQRQNQKEEEVDCVVLNDINNHSPLVLLSTASIA